ncbi:MAG TPA: potassium transporter TrkA [Pusillimonas sp.]|jgi:trk system potassium uptake protein TrkA|nr:potassium transporter TrkA [Pusillimonas sp.]|tara:strand:- start:9518 stop:10171 length:654 start_codon:yes stop_codon:yes gene_type:complete
MGQFAIIGLGRFGSAAALELMKLDHDVIGIDSSEKLVNKYADLLSRAVIADATDRKAIDELALDGYDVVLVGIGADLESSLLCVVHLKSAGVKRIWVKATSRAHHTILSKLGVERIIHPEDEMGVRAAQTLSYPMVDDYISLGNGQFVVEVHIGETLHEAKLNDFLGAQPEKIHVLLIKRKSEIIVHPDNDFTLHTKDVMVLAGQLDTLKLIAPALT